jgi:uncharacterized membrane protein YqiK
MGSVDGVFVLSLGVGLFVIVMGVLVMLGRLYRKVEQGKAMIVNNMNAEPKVTFTGSLVIPVIHKMETMDISLKTIEIDRSGSDGLICQDNIRADIKVAFFVRVSKNKDDVLKVAQSVGCERASNQDTLEVLFSAKFSEALKTVGKSLNFTDLYSKRDNFRDMIIQSIGADLNGYVLEDAAIDYLEQTPVEKLDPQNILDSQGIRKITELTAEQNVHTNELTRDEQLKIKKKDVETREAVLELERQEADAEAKQEREIAVMRSRETAETEKVQHEETFKSEQARILMEEQTGIQEQNKQREIEVASHNRLRTIAIESERVKRAEELEAIEREKEVALQTIANEKLVEIEKRDIAEVIRDRIVVDKTVAEKEEEIKELRMVAEADREKQAQIIRAEAVAEEALVKDVKAAETAEQAASFTAREQKLLAEARLDVAEKDAAATRREAEGIEAMAAAEGLAQAKVLEATARAKEHEGMAEVRVAEAMADAEEKSGLVEARVLLERMTAEAQGLVKKFEAMEAMSESQREHEEFRMQLDKSHEQNMESIGANVNVAKEQAVVLGEALKNANIEIVGGDTGYLDSFVKSLAVGKAIDGTINKSATLSTALEDHLKGDADFIEDARALLESLGSASSEIQNMSVSALVAKLLQEDSPDSQAALSMLKKALARD